jgi:hypothetical protein
MDGAWRNTAYGDCITVSGNGLMVHEACNGDLSQELWPWGHEYFIRPTDTTACLSYTVFDNTSLVLEACNNRGGAYQQFQLWTGGMIMASNAYDGVGDFGLCLGWTEESGNGCNESLDSNVQAMAPGGSFNCLETFPQPANRAWFLAAAQVGMNGGVNLVNFGGAGCLDQCGDSTVTWPKAGWTQPDLYPCTSGDPAQSWSLYFLQ